MIVKSYTGRTVQEALAKVRNDLGEAALIVETRSLKSPGLFGGRIGFEVVAAADQAVPASTRRAAASDTTSLRRTQAEVLARRAAVAAESVASSGHSGHSGHSGAPDLEGELAAIRAQLVRLGTGAPCPTGHLGDLASTFAHAELPDEVVAECDALLGRLGDRLPRARHAELLSRALARNLPCAGDLDWSQPRRLLVVGPTGVGKTTTIAKLAGDLVLKRGARVALATIDTYRIGAAEHLRAYADLLDAPLGVAQTPAQLAELVHGFAGYDHILIDTAGRSPADAARVHELSAFCHAVPGLEVMLAIAATSGRAEFAAVVERFGVLPVEHAVITKIDECAAFGRLYGCLRRHRLAVNYLTTGQEVPDDIVIADGSVLADGIFAVSAGAAA